VFVRIPMAGQADSLNVAMATIITLFGAVRQRSGRSARVQRDEKPGAQPARENFSASSLVVILAVPAAIVTRGE